MTTMKKMRTYMALALMALLPMAFTSCVEDHYWVEDRPWYDDWDDNRWWNDDYANPTDDYVEMAQMLRGHWQGTLVAQGYDEQGKPIRDQYIEFNTDMEFDVYDNPQATFGRGLQRDYEEGMDQPSFVRNFSWRICNKEKGEIKEGDIIIQYDGKDGQSAFEMVIPYDELYLDNKSFTGYMYATDGSETDNFNFLRYTYAKRMALSFE